MTEYVHLIGADEVRSAANTMRSAAEEMSRAANTIDGAMDRHRQFMEDWLMRFEAAVRRPDEPGYASETIGEPVIISSDFKITGD